MDTYPATDDAMIALAQAAGAHALADFKSLVALLLLAAVGLSAWALQRGAEPRAATAATWPDRIAARQVFAFALIAVAVLAFAALAHAVGAGGTFLRVDRVFSEAVHASASEQTLLAFAWITNLGDGRTLALLCIAGAGLLLVRDQRALAIALVAAMGGNGLLNAVLKRVLARVRPPHEQGMQVFHGWSFPSGHSSGALVAYGMLAYLLLRMLPRRWHIPVVLLAATMTLGVGASRVALGAHYAGDVLAGFCSGTAWLTICLLVLERIQRQPRASVGGFVANEQVDAPQPS
jgi:membrane-associated phospholipid phosphatase